MKKCFSRISRVIALCGLVALGYGCVEADELPTKPNQTGIHLTTNVQDWRDEVIYQLIVDRFNNGDINNDFNVDTRSMARYHGGDWQGIIDKLDYLQELGVTTLWISPPVKNVEEDAGFASYHGYWTVDFLKHNPHFGDLATLRRLSDELHKRGMKLILDIVTNHVGQVFFYDINMNGQADEWLAGRGDTDKGSGRTSGELSRVTEYDPDYLAHGIDAYTSMGISGQAPIVFFDMPGINRVAPGPQEIDLDGDGKITTPAEKLGFSNPNWYHQRGRTYDYDSGAEGCTVTQSWNESTQSPNLSDFKCTCERKITNYDYSDGGYLDGERRDYCQNEQTLLGDFPGGLKDVATERNDVRNAMIQVFSYWIDVTNCDGFRIDTLKHVEYSFWEEFADGIRKHAESLGKKNFLMFGEAFDGNDLILSSYTKNVKSVDSVFLFSQKYAIDKAFKCPPGNKVSFCQKNDCANHVCNTGDLYSWQYDDGNGHYYRVPGGRHALFSNEPRANGVVDSNNQGVAPRDLLINFLDNHDVNRYLYERNDDKGVDSLKNALSFLIMQRGIPCIYYGTEQGYMGGNDPANREDMWNRDASVFVKNSSLGYNDYRAWDTGNPLFKHIQKLIKIRKAVPVLRRGKVGEPIYAEYDNGVLKNESIYAFTRELDGKYAAIIVNTHETDSVTVNMTLPWSGSSVDVLNNNESVSGSSISVPAMTTRILIPESDRSSYGL